MESNTLRQVKAVLLRSERILKKLHDRYNKYHNSERYKVAYGSMDLNANVILYNSPAYPYIVDGLTNQVLDVHPPDFIGYASYQAVCLSVKSLAYKTVSKLMIGEIIKKIDPTPEGRQIALD